MINEMWQDYVEIDCYGDEYDANYEEWFVENYLDLGEVCPLYVFYNNCWGALEYCAQEHKTDAHGSGFAYLLLFLKNKGLIKPLVDFNSSIFNSVLTDEGKEVLEWLKERERKEKENEKNIDNSQLA